MVDLRRASPADLCSALVRVKKRPALANASGLEDALGQGGWNVVPADNRSVFGRRYAG